MVVYSVSCQLPTGTYYRLECYHLSIINVKTNILNFMVLPWWCLLNRILWFYFLTEIGKCGCQKCLTKCGRKKRHHISLSAPSILQRPEKKRCIRLTNKQMLAVMKSVQEGEFGLNEAAKQYGAPPTMLRHHLSGHVQHGTNQVHLHALINTKKRFCRHWLCLYQIC